MAGINLSFVADVKSFLTGAGKVEGGLEDVGDALDDLTSEAAQSSDRIGREFDSVGKDAKTAGDKIENSIESAVRESSQEAERLERKFRDVFDDVADKAKTSGKQTRENLEIKPDDIFRESLKAELVSNMAESGAEVARGFKDGFDGEDVETIIDGISDTIVSVGAMSGSALGAAGGLAAATGLNLIAAPLIADAEAKAALYEQVYTEAFDAIKENGAALGAQIAIQTQIAGIAQDTDKMSDALRRANIIGVDQSLIIGAMAGSQGDLAEVTESTSSAIEDQNGRLRRLAEQYQSGEITAAEFHAGQTEADETIRSLNGALSDINSEYGTHKSAVDAAAAGVDALNRATERTNADLTEQAQALAASSGEAQDFAVNIDGATVKLRAMPDGKVVQVTDQGTAELTQQQIDGIDGKVVPVTASADQTQFQNAVDQAARAIRPPTIGFNMSPTVQRRA